MENVRDWKQRRVVSELTHGKEAANQLRNLLQPYSGPQTGAFLIENIVSSFEKALSMLKSEASTEKKKSINDPLLEISDEASKHKNVYKKRKLLPHRSEQVKVCTGTGLDGSLGDGYSWRKYGQKDILGSSFPRGYYRCTHRYGQGCLATKHVQRSDEDPNRFQITYKGRHTCSQTPLPKENAVDRGEEKQEVPQDMCFAAAGEGLLVKTENSDAAYARIFPSSVFPSHFIGLEETNFAESMVNLFAGSISPALSESDFLNPDNFVPGYDFQLSESDLFDIISTPTSVGNSSIGEFEFSLDKVDIDIDIDIDVDIDFPFHDLDSSLNSRVII